MTDDDQANRRWTLEEDKLLVAHYRDHGLEWLVEALPGRTSRAVVSRAHRLGVQSKLWTESELQLLRVCYRSCGAQYCVQQLTGRSLAAVSSQAQRMGLKREGVRPSANSCYTGDSMTGLEKAVELKWVKSWW